MRQGAFAEVLQAFEFQSAHPQGVRQTTKLLLKPREPFQSAHPQGVRPPIYIPYAISKSISISAPARGATFGFASIVLPSRISISAPARGATSVFTDFFFDFSISISAPARGATLSHPTGHREATHFNQRTRKGCDGLNYTGSCYFVDFPSLCITNIRAITIKLFSIALPFSAKYHESTCVSLLRTALTTIQTRHQLQGR